MMDFLKLKLASSKMMKGIITKVIENKIYEKIGCKINIRLNDIQLDVIDGEVKAHLDVDVKMSKSEFNRLIETLGED